MLLRVAQKRGGSRLMAAALHHTKRRLFSRSRKKTIAPDPITALTGWTSPFLEDLDRDFGWPDLLNPRTTGALGLPFMNAIETGRGRFFFDVIDEPDSIKIEADLPGMRMEDIKVRIEGRHLVIEAERKSEVEAEVPWRQKERIYGKLKRVYALPATVDCDEHHVGDLKAKYKDGVLNLELPKLKGVEGRGQVIPVIAEN